MRFVRRTVPTAQMTEAHAPMTDKAASLFNSDCIENVFGLFSCVNRARKCSSNRKSTRNCPYCLADMKHFPSFDTLCRVDALSPGLIAVVLRTQRAICLTFARIPAGERQIVADFAGQKSRSSSGTVLIS
jgi:hypothetical protein